MNAAARLIHQGTLSRSLVFSYLITGRQIAVLCLASLIMISTLSIIYATHSAKLLRTSYQHQLAEQEQLRVQANQLLLERSTLIRQSRVEHIALNKLEMEIPDPKSVVIIRE